MVFLLDFSSFLSMFVAFFKDNSWNEDAAQENSSLPFMVRQHFPALFWSCVFATTGQIGVGFVHIYHHLSQVKHVKDLSSNQESNPRSK